MNNINTARFLIVLVIFIALALMWPSLSLGLFADDWWHVLWVTGKEDNPAKTALSPFGLFSFMDASTQTYNILLDKAALPWWTTSDLKVNFWRPIAELSHWDYRFFAASPVLLHWHSLLWYGALLIVLVQFYQRIFMSNSIVVLSLVFFVAEPFHAISVAWLANRNILIAGVFALVAINFYIDYRRLDKRQLLFFSLSFFLLALLSAEISVSALGVIAAFAVFLDSKPNALRSALPFLLLAIIWFVVYKMLGYGVSGSALMYVDPIANFPVFIWQYLQRIPQVLLLQLAIFPRLLPALFTEQVMIFLGACLCFSLLFGAYCYKNKYIAFVLAAFFFAVLPLASALPHERNFLFVSILTAPLLAYLAQFLWQKGTVFCKSMLFVLFAVRIVISAILVPVVCLYMLYMVNKPALKTADSLPVQAPHLLLVGAPIMHSSFIYPYLLFKQQLHFKSAHVLLSDQSTAQIQQVNDYQWRIIATEGILADEDFFLRDLAKMPFTVGQHIALAEADLLLEKVDAFGNPTQLLLTLPQETAQQYLFLYWQKNQFIR